MRVSGAAKEAGQGAVGRTGGRQGGSSHSQPATAYDRTRGAIMQPICLCNTGQGEARTWSNLHAATAKLVAGRPAGYLGLACGLVPNTHCACPLAARICPADNTWQLLESAIHEINSHNASGLSFEELYRYGDVWGFWVLQWRAGRGVSSCVGRWHGL